MLRKLCRSNELIELTTSPQARKKWPGLPETILAWLVSRTIKDKRVQMIDNVARCLTGTDTGVINNLTAMAQGFVLPERRKWAYPRVVKKDLSAIPWLNMKKEMPVSLH